METGAFLEFPLSAVLSFSSEARSWECDIGLINGCSIHMEVGLRRENFSEHRVGDIKNATAVHARDFNGCLSDFPER